jgi:hypothetical protein
LYERIKKALRGTKKKGKKNGNVNWVETMKQEREIMETMKEKERKPKD